MQPFVPEALPPATLRWDALIPLLGRTNRSLAKFGGMLEVLPNPAVLLSPLTTQEAVLSSKIEGTQATLSDVLKFEAGEAPDEPGRTTDIQEIQNYRATLLAAERELRSRPFSLAMLRGLHGVLLQSVRGKEKTPGQFRATQNWLGAEGCPIERAVFVPPAPVGLIDHLESWESYYRTDQPDPLVQLAVIHAQFEILHPFLDGNGRLGRILIPLFLYEKQLLRRPVFYMSAWLEERRAEYVELLRALGRAPNAWNEWAEFFLRGVEEQAVKNTATAQGILALYAKLKKRALELTHSQYAVPLLDQVFTRPIFTSISLQFGPRTPSKPAVANLLRLLREDGILRILREGAGRRPTLYVMPELLNLCEGRKVF
jgi:Fic family protein